MHCSAPLYETHRKSTKILQDYKSEGVFLSPIFVSDLKTNVKRNAEILISTFPLFIN